jgi:hypothetical protein
VITPEEILEAIKANAVKRRAPGKKSKKAARK